MSRGAADARICAVEQLDIPELALLEARSSVRPWSEVDLVGSLDAGNGCYKLLREMELLGYCVVRETGGELEVLNLVIDASAQRQGFGCHLLLGVMALPRYAGLASVWLEVARDNTTARALYRKLGFVDAGIRKDYYQRQGRPTDACIMTRDLKQTERH